MTNENGKMICARNGDQIPQWWRDLPEEEKEVIRNLVRGLRVLKRSKSPQVARAARKWDHRLSCFIRFRLIGEARSAGKRAARRNAERGVRRGVPTLAPASMRNPPGASPARG